MQLNAVRGRSSTRRTKYSSDDLIGLHSITSLASELGRFIPPLFQNQPLTSNRVQVREVSFSGTDPFCLEAINEYEKEYIQAQKEGKCVQAILLCSPHNPLGLY